MGDADMQHNATPKKRRPQKWERAFITALAASGVVTAACQVAGIERSTAYRNREAHADFATAWDEALEVAADLLEIEARRRAYDGVEEPVFGSGGRGVGTVEVGRARKYSDTLLMFLLKASRPERYRERHEVVGKDGGPLFKAYLGVDVEQV